MGLYDELTINDERCVCSEGHDLSDAEFQTKDLGETMGHWTISGGRIYGQPGGWGVEPDMPINEKIEVYAACTRCPAFVQAGTGNLIDCPVDFQIDIRDNVVQSIKRTSPGTPEFLKDTPLQTWMQGCAGPFSYEEAWRATVDYTTVAMYRGNGAAEETPPFQAAAARLAALGIPADRWIQEQAARRAEALEKYYAKKETT